MSERVQFLTNISQAYPLEETFPPYCIHYDIINILLCTLYSTYYIISTSAPYIILQNITQACTVWRWWLCATHPHCVRHNERITGAVGGIVIVGWFVVLVSGLESGIVSTYGSDS